MDSEHEPSITPRDDPSLSGAGFGAQFIGIFLLSAAALFGFGLLVVVPLLAVWGLTKWNLARREKIWLLVLTAFLELMLLIAMMPGVQ